ncbi:hypothetical protein JOQ06_004914, partial [Pogonophryne albipinna]
LWRAHRHTQWRQQILFVPPVKHRKQRCAKPHKWALFVPKAASSAESECNPWVALTSALLTRCQASEVKLDLGQQVVAMVRSLYNTKNKLPAQCIGHISTLLLQRQPSLQQPALKLMAESGDEQLLKLTLDQINSMTPVSGDVKVWVVQIQAESSSWIAV